MNYVVTKAQLIAIDPSIARVDNLDDLVEAINITASRYMIDQSLRRLRYFVAQAAYETQLFQKFTENLYYSTPQRLVAVWPSRFTMDQNDTRKAYAPDYAKNPEKLANLVYANRMGNGDERSGDGYKYRGRGAFHLTGKDNYQRCSNDLYGDLRLVDNPDSVNSKNYVDGMLSAGWFWDRNGLNELADKDMFTETTRRINGSTSTVNDRLLYLKRANAAITG